MFQNVMCRKVRVDFGESWNRDWIIPLIQLLGSCTCSIIKYKTKAPWDNFVSISAERHQVPLDTFIRKLPKTGYISWRVHSRVHLWGCGTRIHTRLELTHVRMASRVKVIKTSPASLTSIEPRKWPQLQSEHDRFFCSKQFHKNQSISVTEIATQLSDLFCRSSEIRGDRKGMFTGAHLFIYDSRSNVEHQQNSNHMDCVRNAHALYPRETDEHRLC